MRKFLPLFLLVFSTYGFSQNVEIQLYSGNAYFQNISTKKWTTFSKNNHILNIKTKLKIEENSQVLIKNNNHFYLFDKPGIWIAEQLLSKKKDDDFLEKYTSFLIQGLFGRNKENINENPEAYFNQKGVAYRGNTGCITLIKPYSGSYYDGDSIQFFWNGFQKNQFLQIFESEESFFFLQKKVEGNSIKLPISEITKSGNRQLSEFYWTISPIKDQKTNCKYFKLKIANPSDFDRAFENYNFKIIPDNYKDLMAIGSFYENFNFLNQAEEYYKMAYKLDLENKIAKNKYIDFLDKVGRYDLIKSIK